MTTPTPGEDTALAAIAATGVKYTVSRHGPVSSLAEAAAARGVEPGAVIKTLVVRRADDDYVLVLVPGDRGISWPKLRALLGVSRLSMPDAETARAATGYERGTITPFGALGGWPVVADTQIPAWPAVSVGGGGHGVAFTLSGADLVAAVGALPRSLPDGTDGVRVADVTEPL